MKEQFIVRNRWTGAVQFTAEIDTTPDMSPRLKLGLAVRWGYENGASLVGARLDGARLDGALLDGAHLDGAILVGARLDGASLDGASLDGARLVGASLVGARLVGASLVGASLDGARLDGARLDGARLVGASLDGAHLVGKKVSKLIARVTRNDGYEFFLWLFQDGSHVIRAGCQTHDIPGYRAHVAEDYPRRPNAAEVTRETLAILDYLERRLKDETPKPKRVRKAREEVK